MTPKFKQLALLLALLVSSVLAPAQVGKLQIQDNSGNAIKTWESGQATLQCGTNLSCVVDPITGKVILNGAGAGGAAFYQQTSNASSVLPTQYRLNFMGGVQAANNGVSTQTDVSLAPATGATLGGLILTGDLGGSAATPRVVSFQGFPISNQTPTTGQIMAFNGTSWVPTTSALGGASAGTVTLVGLSAPAGVFTVGGSVSTTGNLSFAYVPQPINMFLASPATGGGTAAPSFRHIAGADLPVAGNGGAMGAVALGGDIGGAATGPTVVGIQGYPVSSAIPTLGQTLAWSGTAYVPTSMASMAGSGAVSSVFGRTGTVVSANGDYDLSQITGNLLATQLPALAGGDVNSVAGSGVLTLAPTGITPGTYTKISIDANGRATQATQLVASDVPAHQHVEADVAGLPADLAARIQISALQRPNGVAGLDGGGRLFSGSFPALTGDVTNLAGSTNVTLNPTGVVPGTYSSVNVDANGRVLTGGSVVLSSLAGVALPAQLPPATTLAQGTVILAGDFGGVAGVPKVIGMQGTPVSNTPPATGQVLQFNGVTWAPTTVAGGGTVQSVAMVLPSTVFTVTGSPVTNIGTLGATFKTQNANSFFAAPSAGSGVPVFRSIAAADLPAAAGGSVGGVALSGDFGGTATTPQVVGIRGVPVVATAPLNGQILSYNGTSYVPTTFGGNVASVFGRTGTVVAAANDYSFAQISGSMACSQRPAQTGDVTSAAGSCAAAIAPSGATAGTYQSVTVNAKGQVTSGTTQSFAQLTGSATSAQLPSATTGAQGILQLAGDLAGTAALPSVVRIQGVPVTATTPLNGQALIYNGTNYVPTTLGAGSGTVTSVGLSTPNVIFTVAGSPVTANGTIALNLISQAAGTFLAGPTSGGNLAPTFRPMATSDLALVDVAHGGTGQTSTVLAFDAISPLNTVGDVLFFNGTDNTRLAGNTTTARRFLTSAGTGSASTAPSWTALTASDIGAGTMTGKLTLPPSGAGGAGFNIGAGTIPTTPVAGDFWLTTGVGAGIFWRGTQTHEMEDQTNKGVASGYAPLDATGLVPAANLPAANGNGLLYISTTPVTAAAATTSPQYLMTYAMPAGLMNLVGKAIRIRAAGTYSTTTPIPSIILRLTILGVATIYGSSPITPTVVGTNNSWSLDVVLYTTTAGASGVTATDGTVTVAMSTLNGATMSDLAHFSSVWNDTVAQTLQAAVVFGSANTGNSMTQTFMQITTLN